MPNEVDPLARIEAAAQHLSVREHWERSNRLALLWVHAVVAIGIGIVMLTDGTATYFEVVLGAVRAQWVTGVPALLGGVLLAAGLVARPRNIRLEIAGLAVIAAWDLGMSAGFVVSVLNPPAGVMVRIYPILVYGGYLALLGVHLWTLSTRHWRRP